MPQLPDRPQPGLPVPAAPDPIGAPASATAGPAGGVSLQRRQGLRRGAALAGAWWLSGLPGGTALAAAPPAGVADGGAGTPVYRTRLPAAAVLEYALSYGFVSGFGRLVWEPPLAGRYRLHLVGRAFGLQLLEWLSEGGVDAAGLAPWRFVERRIGRDERVAEFRREAGRIHYPARPSRDVPLPPGAQDRLSWLVQLPAILRADPSLVVAGRQIELFVSGAHGEAEPWVFEIASREDGQVHLRRRSGPGAEVRGEAWLSSALDLLPLRVRLVNDRNDVLEMRLRNR